MKTPAHNLLLIVCTLLILLPGCKKDRTNATTTARVKTSKTTAYSGVYSNDTSSYFYDEQGRLIVHQSRTDVTTYQYDGHQVTQTHNFSAPVIYQLDDQGLAVSDDHGNTFTYNASGRLVLKRNKFGDTVLANVISNGDVTSTFASGPINRDTFSYATTAEMRDFGTSFLGKGAPHLLQEERTSAPPGSYVSYRFILAHAYEFDAAGRVTKETVTETITNQVWAVMLFEY